MKLTRIFPLAVFVAGSLVAGNIALQAQDNTNNPPAGASSGGKHARPGFDAIAKQLELTDDQKPKVKAVLDDMQQKQRDLRSDTSVAPADKRAKVKEIREAANAQLKDILTPEQFAKWRKMNQGMRRNGPPGSDPGAAKPANN